MRDLSDIASLSSLAGEPLQDQVEVFPDDIAALSYSTGTTGLSKGVMLSHGNVVENLIQTFAMLPIAEGDTILSFLPLVYIYLGR